MRAKTLLAIIVGLLACGSAYADDADDADDTQQRITVLNWVRWDNDNDRRRNRQIRLWCGSPADDVGMELNPWPAEVGDWFGTSMSCEPEDDTGGLWPGQIAHYYFRDDAGVAWPRFHTHKSNPLFAYVDGELHSLQGMSFSGAENHAWFSVDLSDLGGDASACMDYYVVVRWMPSEEASEDCGVEQPPASVYPHHALSQNTSGYFLATGHCGMPTEPVITCGPNFTCE